MVEDQSNYWQQSRRPLVSLVFVLPLLLIYEGGVLAGRYGLGEAVFAYEEGGFDIIAGHSGSGSLASLPADRLARLTVELAKLAPSYDRVVLDLGAGVERTVRQLAARARSCLVISTDEPTSMTDAYAFIKVTSLEHPSTDMRIVVNMAPSKNEGMRVYETLHRVCEKFLCLSPALAGVVRRDNHVRDSIRRQTAMLTRHPTSIAALDVEHIADRLAAEK